MDGLTALRELDLRDNALREMPEALATLPLLRRLDLRGNPLRRLPEALAAAPSLEKLDLRWSGVGEDEKSVRELLARGCVVLL